MDEANFIYVRKLGEGAFGDVFVGLYKDPKKPEEK